MKRMLLGLVLLLGCAGCDLKLRIDLDKFGPKPTPVINEERPTVNLPDVLRQKNWRGDKGEGSCVWASTISLLRWQGRYHTADWIRRNYGNGEWPDHWIERADKIGLRYAITTDGDVSFLEWACKTRRGAGITVMGGKHMVCLVHLDSQWAALLDNNAPSKYIWVPRETLIAEWKASYGWALTPIYTPAAPLPQ
jgi:hypothetical protein